MQYYVDTVRDFSLLDTHEFLIPVVHSGEYISVTTLLDFHFVAQDLNDIIYSYIRRNVF